MKFNKRNHPIYCCWRDIHKRIENDPELSICEDWKDYNKFALWYEENHRQDYIFSKVVLYPNNKIYSPETCLCTSKIFQ